MYKNKAYFHSALKTAEQLLRLGYNHVPSPILVSTMRIFCFCCRRRLAEKYHPDRAKRASVAPRASFTCQEDPTLSFLYVLSKIPV